MKNTCERFFHGRFFNEPPAVRQACARRGIEETGGRSESRGSSATGVHLKKSPGVALEPAWIRKLILGKGISGQTQGYFGGLRHRFLRRGRQGNQSILF